MEGSIVIDEEGARAIDEAQLLSGFLSHRSALLCSSLSWGRGGVWVELRDLKHPSLLS